MSDIQEIRRFWPKAVWWGANTHAATNWLRGLLWIERVKLDSYRVVFAYPWRRRMFDGPTIAAAMAAAGFGERKKGPCAKRNRQESYWSLPGGYDPFVKLEGRQRPRKGVRLGRRGRRKARGLDRQYKPTGHDDRVDAAHWALLAQQRLDRGEIGG